MLQERSRSWPAYRLSHLRALLEQGTVTSRELTEQALDAARHSSEAAATFIAVHEASALATADSVDRLLEAGVPLPPLAGIPISIKDLFDEAGQVTRAGSRVLEGSAPAKHDSAIVARLRAAGAVIVGRTNMTEFAYSGLGLNPHYGTPRNPWRRAEGRIPGGSSSGAAISVTDGMAAAAIGTDTGGSVRIPSALCGLTGFKPTARRVSAEGCLPLATSLDSIGPLARSVECCALLDAVLAGETPHAFMPTPIAGRRLGVPRQLVFDGIDGTVAAAFERARQRLLAAGALVVDIDLPEFDELAGINRFGGFTSSQAFAWHEALIESSGDRYDPTVVSRLRRGASMTAAQYITLLADRKRWITAVAARLQGPDGVDALLMPTVPIVAPTIADLQADDAVYTATNVLVLRNPTFIKFLDGCALSLPCHRPGDAPVGLMLAALGGQDEAILRLGAAVEAVLQAD
ncbi:MAG: amidase family protein [Rhizobacter sp.]|nr:amidase family protein [Rhizobacter sp.]